MKNILLVNVLFLMACQYCQAQAKNTWATASTGGEYGFGTLLKGDSTGHNFTVVHQFDQVNGSYPIGKLAVADNGVIYCVTELGGYDDSCTICTYDPATGSFTMIHQFFVNQNTGSVPYSGLIKLPNGLLYGTTTTGGSNTDTLTSTSSGGGVIYTVDPVTNTYTDVYDFPDSTGFGPLSELLPAADGNLYVIKPVDSSAQGYATLYRFNPANNQGTRIYTFNTSVEFENRCPALVQGPDARLYGVIILQYQYTPGATQGYLFSYDLTTSTFTDLHHFSDSDGIPQGGLLALNGNIYGETYNPDNYGQIYSYNIAGNRFTKEANFNQVSGAQPFAGLAAWSGNRITGSTTVGGAYYGGTLFTFDPGTHTFTDLFDFDNATTGSGPMCDLLETGFSPTAIARVANTTPEIYPNPASDVLYVRNAQPNTPFTITNALGQVVETGTITTTNQAINLDALQAGVYMINNTRFVKQ